MPCMQVARASPVAQAARSTNGLDTRGRTCRPARASGWSRAPTPAPSAPGYPGCSPRRRNVGCRSSAPGRLGGLHFSARPPSSRRMATHFCFECYFNQYTGSFHHYFHYPCHPTLGECRGGTLRHRPLPEQFPAQLAGPGRGQSSSLAAARHSTQDASTIVLRARPTVGRPTGGLAAIAIA